MPRSKRLDLRVSEEELLELRRLAGERGISIQRMLVDDALTRRAADKGAAGGLDGVVIDELVGELMRLRGDIGRAGNTANQAVRDARRLDSEDRKAMRLTEAVEAVTRDRQSSLGRAEGSDEFGAVAVIPNITRGGDIAGVVGYLAGPGNKNEHENPTLIAASLGIATEAGFKTRELDDRSMQHALASVLDAPGSCGAVRSGAAIRPAVR